jgi:hypothetical protein
MMIGAYGPLIYCVITHSSSVFASSRSKTPGLMCPVSIGVRHAGFVLRHSATVPHSLLMGAVAFTIIIVKKLPQLHRARKFSHPDNSTALSPSSASRLASLVTMPHFIHSICLPSGQPL